MVPAYILFRLDLKATSTDFTIFNAAFIIICLIFPATNSIITLLLVHAVTKLLLCVHWCPIHRRSLNLVLLKIGDFFLHPAIIV